MPLQCFVLFAPRVGDCGMGIKVMAACFLAVFSQARGIVQNFSIREDEEMLRALGFKLRFQFGRHKPVDIDVDPRCCVENPNHLAVVFTRNQTIVAQFGRVVFGQNNGQVDVRFRTLELISNAPLKHNSAERIHSADFRDE